MIAFIVRRIISGIGVLFGVSLFSFALIHLIPGDPVRIMLGENASAEQIARIRHQLGLDKPLVVQYLQYMWNILHGNLGVSLKTGQPVLSEIFHRFGATIELAAGGLVFAVVFGILTGVVAANKQDTWIDNVVTVISTLGVSVPSFWLGLLLIMLFSVKLGWLPVAGGTGFADLIMPAVTLGFLASTVISRLTRTGMVEVLSSDYVRTALAKGIRRPRVLFKHALRNALIPVVTILGLQLATLLGGTFIIEQVFDWPGMGTLTILAIQSRDFPMVQGIILVLGWTYVIVNLCVDILYGVIDPRIDVGKGEAA